MGKQKAAPDKKQYNGGALVSAPAAIGRSGLVARAAKVSGNPYAPGGSLRIRHREYLGELLGSTAIFTNVQYSVNPGLASTFPFASQMACQFEEYRFHRLVFSFESEKASTAAGYVMMGIDYDSSDATPTNKQQLAASLGSVRTQVWQHIQEVASPEQLSKQRELYVRMGTLAANLDIKTYDIGTLNVAVGNCADASSLGELYVEYDLEFRVPQLDLHASATATSATIASGAAVSETAIFGTTGTVTGPLPVTAAANTLTFNKIGYYIVEIQLVGTVFIDGLVTYTGTATTEAGAFAVPLSGLLANQARTLAIFNSGIAISRAGQTVIFDESTLGATVSLSTVRIGMYGLN